MTLVGQTNTNEINSKTFSDQIDIDGDGTKDLQVVYEEFQASSGYLRYNAKVILRNPGIEVYGRIMEIWGGPNRVVSMALADQEILLRSGKWGQFDDSTVQLFLKEEQNGEPINQFNFFPNPNQNAYLLFKVNKETPIIGWLHLKQSEELWQLEYLDIGFKQFD